jgi:hypothetical protein
LALGAVVGVSGFLAWASFKQHNGVPSAICATSRQPLAFVDPPAYARPFVNWRPLPPALDLQSGPDGTAVWTDGTLHPGATAERGIRALNVGDRDTANHMADALMAHADGVRFPYRFDFPQEHEKAPWTSMFAQGLALVLFTWLDRPEAPAIAGTITPDAGGWFEEYPGSSPVVDGHIFAALGLYEYAHASGDKRAERRALDAIELVRAQVGVFVTSSGVWYDLQHEQRLGALYPSIEIEQFSWLSAITGERCFDDVARAVLAGHG